MRRAYRGPRAGRRRRRGGIPLQSSLMLAGVTFVAAAALGGGCYRPDDTTPNLPQGFVVSSSSVSSSSAGGAGGAAASSTSSTGGNVEDLPPEQYFDQVVKDEFVTACAGAGCHSSGGINFLPSGQEYGTITTYKTTQIAKGTKLVRKDYQTSMLLTYPNKDDHTGAESPTVQAYDDPGGVKELVQSWLAKEAELLPDSEAIEVGPFELKQGLNSFPLEALGEEFGEHEIAFYAEEIGDPATILEITGIEVYPIANRGLRIKDPTFVTYPPDPEEDPILNIGLHGEAVVYVYPGVTTIGTGSLVITDWVPGAKLSLQFDTIEVVYADAIGNAYAACTDPDAFQAATETLVESKALSVPNGNGLLGCAISCHGGADEDATNAFYLQPLLQDPIDWPYACALARSQIVAGNPAESPLFRFTNPDGTGVALGHEEFTFSADTMKYNEFVAGMSAWVNGE